MRDTWVRYDFYGLAGFINQEYFFLLQVTTKLEEVEGREPQREEQGDEDRDEPDGEWMDAVDVGGAEDREMDQDEGQAKPRRSGRGGSSNGSNGGSKVSDGKQLIPKKRDPPNAWKRRCADGDCQLAASFGRLGKQAIYCSAHKDTGMVNVTHRRCDEPGWVTFVVRVHGLQCRFIMLSQAVNCALHLSRPCPRIAIASTLLQLVRRTPRRALPAPRLICAGLPFHITARAQHNRCEILGRQSCQQISVIPRTPSICAPFRVLGVQMRTSAQLQH